MKAAVLILLGMTLSGCAGVSDQRGLSALFLVVHQDGVPMRRVAVAVMSHGQKREGVTDSRGEATFEFTYLWNSMFWIIPPIGNVPRRSAKPEYLIQVAGREISVRADSNATTYDERAGEWKTSVTVDVKAP